MDLELAGRVAIVTGASKGIGRAVALALGAEGCKVGLVARRVAELDDAAEAIRAIGAPTPLVVAQDVTAHDAPTRIHDTVRSMFGPVGILVNCAGGSRPVPLDAPAEVWNDGIELNFGAIRRLTAAMVPHMSAQAWGRVINVTGSSEPTALNVASPAKAAVHAWSKALSRELARDGITVNCVPPGYTLTDQILNRVFPEEAERQQFIDEKIPIGYMADPSDSAALIAFLASPKARYITGAVIPVDGGMRRFAF